MRKCWTFAASAIFMTAVAAAEPRSGSFVVELSDGSRMTALDAPVRRGTVVTFHDASGGTLTGVPAEMVVRIVREGKTSVSRARPLVGTRPAITIARPPATGLEPGEILVIGPTGDGAMLSNLAASSGNAGVANGMGTGSPGYGGSLDPNVINPNVGIYPNANTGVNPNGVLIGTDGLPRVPSSTDLSRAQAAQTSVGPNGFPVTTNTNVPTVIGPNGTPTLAPGVPGSAATTVIGPNGTPVTTTGSPQMVIGPNGTPVVASPGQPGSAQPVIGPNGTPVLAQPGQPGAAQPNIGPNGTPVVAPPGQPGSTAPSIAPNGTPSTPSGTGSSPSSGTGNAGPGSR
jgi:hypothetical protein